MNIYIVQADHFRVPGRPMSAHFDKASAAATALDHVRTLWEEIASDIGDEEDLPAKMPECWTADNWQVALRLALIARVEMNGAALTDDERDDEEFLVGEAGCDVWIDEIAIAEPEGQPWAHPVPLATMEAYRHLAGMASDMLDAFGGDTPKWLAPEAGALAHALGQCDTLDPPANRKANTPPPVRVVVNISGGVVQGASASAPVDLYSLDFDDIDTYGPDVITVPGEREGSQAVRGECGAKVDPEWVAAVIAAPFDNLAKEDD